MNVETYLKNNIACVRAKCWRGYVRADRLPRSTLVNLMHILLFESSYPSLYDAFKLYAHAIKWGMLLYERSNLTGLLLDWGLQACVRVLSASFSMNDSAIHLETKLVQSRQEPTWLAWLYNWLTELNWGHRVLLCEDTASGFLTVGARRTTEPVRRSIVH